jgi:hypothetical protein
MKIESADAQKRYEIKFGVFVINNNNVVTTQVLAIALVWCCMQTCTGWEQLGIVQTRLQNLVRQQNRFVYNQCFARSVSDNRRLTLMAIYLLIPKQIQGKGNQIKFLTSNIRTGNVNVLHD